MNSTAADVARIEEAYPAWQVYPTAKGWAARHRKTRTIVYVEDLTTLEITLASITE